MPTRRPGVPTRPSPRCGGGGRPALPCPFSRARRLPTPSSSPASPPQAAEAAAAAAARARLRRPAGARGAARVGGCQPALASPPPVSSLSRPGPLRRRPRRPAPPPTQPLSPRPRLQRAWLIYARPAPRTRSRAQPRAAGHRLLPVPAPRPQPASAGGRLFLAQLRREVGHQRARSPRDCADCGAPGGAGVTGRANQQQTPRPCRTLLIANSNNCMRDLEQVISISRKGLRALLWNYQLNRA